MEFSHLIDLLLVQNNKCQLFCLNQINVETVTQYFA